MKARIFLCLLALPALLCGCGSADEPEGADTGFAVTSSSLNADGSWSAAITNTAAGQNLSPQLSWEAADGAGCYVVYMIDTTAGNWLHWKADGLTVTELPEGANPGEYVGPYPPSGTHEYTVYVFALKAAPDSFPGRFDARNKNFGAIADTLNVSGGAAGNLLSSGSVTGTYESQ